MKLTPLEFVNYVLSRTGVQEREVLEGPNS